MTVTHAFIGYRKCGNAAFVEADTGQRRLGFSMEDGNEVLDVLRAGGTIERIPIEDARKVGLCFGFGCGGCT